MIEYFPFVLSLSKHEFSFFSTLLEIPSSRTDCDYRAQRFRGESTKMPRGGINR